MNEMLILKAPKVSFFDLSSQKRFLPGEFILLDLRSHFLE